MRLFHVLFAFVLFLKGSFSDFYSAVFDMTPLIKTEGSIIQALETYVKDMDEKLSKVKWHLKHFQKEHKKVCEDFEEYVHNPINAFLLIKRLTTDWMEIESAIRKNPGSDLVRNISQTKDLQFPDYEDLSAAAQALVRLHKTYNLTISDISNGILNGLQFDSHLKAVDCFQIGIQLYEMEDYDQTVLWMTEADRIQAEEIYKTVARTLILGYLIYSLYMENDISKALELTDELLNIEPNNEMGLYNKNIFEEVLRNPENETIKEIMNESGVNRFKRGTYEKLCSNEVTVDVSIKSQLKCRYVDYERPFLKLARLKEEELYLRPKILLYHDVLYDKEIQTFLEIVKPNMTRSRVRKGNQTSEKSMARVSKLSWLRDGDHSFVEVLNRRVEDITGLTTKTGEAFQVQNYGIGGHYAPHYDWMSTDKKFTSSFANFGNRIGTILFYMSDVKQGGGTAFPNLKVTVWPKKGMAVFWPNLFYNGTGNKLMLHAACPVISGSKWVINKWLHERGQEFRRPCALSRDEM